MIICLSYITYSISKDKRIFICDKMKKRKKKGARQDDSIK